MTVHKAHKIPSVNMTEVLTRTSARHLDFVIQENLTGKKPWHF